MAKNEKNAQNEKNVQNSSNTPYTDTHGGQSKKETGAKNEKNENQAKANNANGQNCR